MVYGLWFMGYGLWFTCGFRPEPSWPRSTVTFEPLISVISISSYPTYESGPLSQSTAFGATKFTTEKLY